MLKIGFASILWLRRRPGIILRTRSNTGGQYTLKVYSSGKVEDPEGGWRHVEITLNRLDPTHAPIVLAPKDEGQVRVIAELVGVAKPAEDALVT